MRGQGGSHWRPAGGTIRQPVETGGIGGRIMIGNGHAGHLRPRIGKRQAGVQAFGGCGRARGADNLPATILRDQHQRRLVCPVQPFS